MIFIINIIIIIINLNINLEFDILFKHTNHNFRIKNKSNKAWNHFQKDFQSCSFSQIEQASLWHWLCGLCIKGQIFLLPLKHKMLFRTLLYHSWIAWVIGFLINSFIFCFINNIVFAASFQRAREEATHSCIQCIYCLGPLSASAPAHTGNGLLAHYYGCM